MLNPRAAGSVLVSVALSACAAQSGVVALGNETYMASKQAATGFSGLGNLKADLIAEGAAHCRTVSHQFELLTAQETQPPYVLGNFPRAEITFKCTPR